MLLEVVAGAVVGLLVLAGLVVLVLRRAPFALVADTLPGTRHGGADEVDELVTESDGVDDLVGGEGGRDGRTGDDAE